MDPRPIGIFDSGIGGLTVMRALRARLPHENLVYLGDTARVPYGNKSEATVSRYSEEDTRFLLTKNVKMVVIACNTASALAAPALHTAFPGLPLLGMIGPGARAAVQATQNGRIGVIATAATIGSHAYEGRIREAWVESGNSGGIEILARACPLFVPLVEEGELDSPITRLVVEKYLTPLRAEGIDTLVLGCTHYPLLTGAIAAVMGPEVTLVDSATAAALEAADLLTEQNLLHPGDEPGDESFYVTDAAARFHSTAARFLGHPPERLELADISPS